MIKIMKKNKLLEKITKEQLIADFVELGSAHKIAKKYDMWVPVIYDAFKIIDYNCYIIKRNKDIRFTLTKTILEEAYNRLGSLSACGREFDADAGTIKQYMIKFGLDYKKQVRYNCDHDYFSRDTAEVFYIAGFMAADGCVKKRKNTYGNFRCEVQIALSKNDKDFLIAIKDLLKAETPITDRLSKANERNPKWNNTWSSQFTITSEKMVKDLERFNIVPAKSLIYTFPQWLIDHPLVSHFMRGYNDGDGSFYIGRLKGNRTVEQIHFSLRGTKKFLTTFRSILEKNCDLKIRTKDIRINCGTGMLEYGGNGVLSKITDFLYKDATIFLQRKYDIAIKSKRIK